MSHPIRYLIILSLCAALLFAGDSQGLFAVASDASRQAIVAPVARVTTAMVDSGRGVFDSLFRFRMLIREHASLEMERDFYRGEYMRLRAVEEENKFLRSALELDETGEAKLVLARAITFDPLRTHHAIELDKGSSDGLSVGDAVILAGNILVGRIVEVAPRTSTALLVNSDQSRITSQLERSETNAVITGSASGALILELVLPETDVREGEIIVTSGLEDGIPQNLLVGQVYKVISDESASFKQAVVRPFFDFRNIRDVFVVTN